MIHLFIMLFINPLNFCIMEFKKVQVLKTIYVYQKNRWVYDCETLSTLTPAEYITFTSRGTVSWFRRLGSKQVLKRSHTSFGHLVTQLSSYSPDNSEKHVFNFRFLY